MYYSYFGSTADRTEVSVPGVVFVFLVGWLVGAMPGGLFVSRCLPHTSFLGFFAAFSSNIFPCLGEILYLFYSYNATTYIDQQTVVPSFWFRWWRPAFLIAGMLYDVGMLAYSIYMEDVSAVMLAVRIAIGLYQLNDQLWLVKHWVPFFVQKEKQRFLIVRFYIIGCIWLLVLGSTSWTGSWQKNNDIFASVYYISQLVICFFCGFWYLAQGGIDFLVKYRFHSARNLFGLLAFSAMILGIVGLIIGDGGGNNLAETLNYHSAFVMIYFYVECTIAMMVHRFIVVIAELSWEYPNPSTVPSSLSHNEATALGAVNGFVPVNNKVACDVDVPTSSIEGARTGSIPQETVAVVASPTHFAEGGVIVDTKPSNGEERIVEDGGKEEGDLEAAHDLVSQPATAMSPPATAPVSTRANSMVVFYQARRRLALAFDGITRRISELRSSILTQHTMMAKLKRHELVCREFDKVYCVVYQMYVWETVMWLAQIFLALYLQSVNTPTPSGQTGYYCLSPLENTANSAQFANDFVFARR